MIKKETIDGEKKDSNKTLIIFITFLLVAIIVGEFFYYHQKCNAPNQKRFSEFDGQRNPENFSLNQSQLNEVTSTFEKNQEEINSYCQQKMDPCIYYCREINQENEVCKKLKPEGEPLKR